MKLLKLLKLSYVQLNPIEILGLAIELLKYLIFTLNLVVDINCNRKW